MEKGLTKTEDNENNEQVDVIEELMVFFLKNKDLSTQFLDLLKALKDSGAIEDIASFFGSIMPSNSALVKEIGGSKEVESAISKAGNLLPGLLYLLSVDSARSAISAILYNSDTIFSSMITGAKNPEQFSLFKLLALLKDPEFTKGMTAMVNLITSLGKALSKTPGD